MSIASRITSIEGHIEEDYNALERLGADLTGVDKNIENIASVVNDIYDKLPKVTGTGSDLSLTPTLKGALSINPLGNAEQNSYNGKNLLNASQESYTLPASTTNYQNIANIDLVANTKYYISYNIDNTSSSNTRSTPRLYYQQQYVESGSTNYNLTTGRKVWEFTPNASGTYQFQYWLQGSNVAVTVSKFMISTSNDTTYEQYVGGIPSPNPSYPQNVKVVTGDNQVVISNKNNLPNIDDYTGTGITISNNIYTCNYEGGINTGIRALKSSYTIKNGDYLHLLNNKANNNIQFDLYLSDNTGIVATTLSNINQITDLSSYAGKIVSKIRVYANNNYNDNITIKPMILHTSTLDTNFIPHQEQSTTLHLGSLELCKIGDYQDVITGTKDNWKVVRKIRHLNLAIADMNNTDDYPGWKSQSQVVTDLGISSNSSISYDNGRCNIKGSGKLCNVNVDGLLYLSKGDYSNYTQTYWKSNYSNLIFNLYYGIINTEAQYEETITDTTLINELNELQELLSYDGTTNITITSASSNAQMLVQVSALKGE